MAIIDKDGMIRGLVGNLVCRVVNGKGVLQSRPRPRKPSGKTLIENEQFADGSELSKELYPLLKDFGWNRCYSYLFGRLTTYLKRFLHGDLADVTVGEYLAMDRNDGIRQLFKRLPTAKREEKMLSFDIPAVAPFKENHRTAYVEYFSYEVVLLGACTEDVSIDKFDVLYSFETEIFKNTDGYPEQNIKVDFEQLDVSKANLLVVGFRVKLLEHPASSAFSNSKEANPVGILGMWRL